MPLQFPLVVAALLFAIGTYAVLARRNAVLVLMGVELMLNAVNLNLVAFDAYLRDVVHSGQVLTLFVIAVAAAEIGLGLAIVLVVFRANGHIDADRLRALADRDEVDEAIASESAAPEVTQAAGVEGSAGSGSGGTGGEAPGEAAGEPAKPMSAVSGS